MEGQQELVGELLPPEIKTPEDVDVSSLVPLEIKTPLQQWKDLFTRMTQVREQAILWESKTVIKDAKTRDEAISLRTFVTRLKTRIDDVRKAMQENVRLYINEMNGYAKDAWLPLAGENPNDQQGVAGRLTAKINAYAEECRREEVRLKAEALARQQALEREQRAQEEKRKMEEQRLRLEEEERLKKIHEEALQKAQAEGKTETDEMAADIAMEEAQAQIEADRAYRERQERERLAKEREEVDRVAAETAGQMAKATAKGKLKGVKEIWVIECVDPTKVPRQFCSPDETKIRKYVESGVSEEKDAEKIVPGYRCYVALGKGGR